MNEREIVVISGKGGTGKTSILASFAALARRSTPEGTSSAEDGSTPGGVAVIADCDVDAADLHLVLDPTILRREEFRCGNVASIRREACCLCGSCVNLCRFDAVREEIGERGEAVFTIDPTACEGCGVCVDRCPAQAIDFPERVSGEWFISETRHGPLVHARLTPGAESSGKLVSKVREAARQVAGERRADLILVDGPPGVGCPVIASIGGASLVLVVTEPTLSGVHDLRRVMELTRHFGIPTAVCVNKWDIHPELTEEIEAEAVASGGIVAGRVRYDPAFTRAQLRGRTVVEMSGGGAQETGAQETGAQETGAQETGAQETGAQGTGAQGTGAQGTGAEKDVEALWQSVEASLEAIAPGGSRARVVELGPLGSGVGGWKKETSQERRP